MDQSEIIRSPVFASGDRATGLSFDGRLDTAGGFDRSSRADNSTAECDRPSGTQPRNRQHRAMEYYFGRRELCQVIAASTPTLICRFNPYRTQLVITFYSNIAASSPWNLAHSQASLIANHAVFAGEIWPAGTAGGPPYAQTVHLDFTNNGPMVCEEWWGRTSGLCNMDSTEYFYSD